MEGSHLTIARVWKNCLASLGCGKHFSQFRVWTGMLASLGCGVVDRHSSQFREGERRFAWSRLGSKGGWAPRGPYVLLFPL